MLPPGFFLSFFFFRNRFAPPSPIQTGRRSITASHVRKFPPGIPSSFFLRFESSFFYLRKPLRISERSQKSLFCAKPSSSLCPGWIKGIFSSGHVSRGDALLLLEAFFFDWQHRLFRGRDAQDGLPFFPGRQKYSIRSV